MIVVLIMTEFFDTKYFVERQSKLSDASCELSVKLVYLLCTL